MSICIKLILSFVHAVLSVKYTLSSLTQFPFFQRFSYNFVNVLGLFFALVHNHSKSKFGAEALKLYRLVMHMKFVNVSRTHVVILVFLVIR